MTAMNSHRSHTLLLIGAASLVLGVATTSAMALAIGGGPAPAAPGRPASPTCRPPALPGAVVDVTFTDMDGMMGPGVGMMGPGMTGSAMGMMRINITPGSVPAGLVSLKVFNSGRLPHEVVVLPLVPGQSVGQRQAGADGTVDETGSLGEAARTCGGGDGEGVAPGTWSWATLTLPPGRYELICNIAGHYSMGMYTELDAT